MEERTAFVSTQLGERASITPYRQSPICHLATRRTRTSAWNSAGVFNSPARRCGLPAQILTGVFDQSPCAELYDDERFKLDSKIQNECTTEETKRFTRRGKKAIHSSDVH